MEPPDHQGRSGNFTIAFDNRSDGTMKIIQLFGRHEFRRANLSRLIDQGFDRRMDRIAVRDYEPDGVSYFR